MTELEQLLRDDLHRATTDLDIEVDAAAILTQHRTARRRRVWTWVAVGAAGLAFGLTAWSALGGLGNVIPGVPDPRQSPAPIPSGSASPPPSVPTGSNASSTPTLNPVPTIAASIYFLDFSTQEMPEDINKWAGNPVPNDIDGLISREIRQVTAATPVRGALEAMLAGPQSETLVALWPTDTRVLGISQADGIITVDLSGEARNASVGAASEVTMVQTLVWTVTAAYAMPEASVRLLIEGAPAGEAWGHMVWDAPIPRDAPLGTLSRIIVDTPLWKETVGSPVRISGEAAVFEATLAYTVFDVGTALAKQENLSDHVVAQGFTMTAEGQAFSPFSFEVALPPGDYSVELSEPDASGGLSGQPGPTTFQRFTIR